MTTATRGSCYGFEVTSELPLSFLRTSTNAGVPLTVRPGSIPEEDGNLLQEWNLARVGKLTTRLFGTGPGRYLIRIGITETRADVDRILVIDDIDYCLLTRGRVFDGPNLMQVLDGLEELSASTEGSS